MPQPQRVNPGGGSGPHPPQASVTALNYKPVFLTDVVTTSANGVQTPVNPVYCLTKESGEQLAQILNDLSPVVYMTTPQLMQQGAGGVSVNHLVAWLKFPSGCAVNGGVEANWWTNTDGATAEKNCRLDIQAAEQQYAVEGGDQQA